MAVTFSSLEEVSNGNKRKRVGLMQVTAASETISAADLGMTQLDSFRAQPKDGYVFEFVKATGALTMKYADYDAVADGTLITAANATVSNINIEAEGY